MTYQELCKKYKVDTLRSMDLTGIDLGWCDLRGADFSNSNLSYANLTNANLIESKFSFANLTKANLRSSDLTGSNLTGANLSYTNLHYTNLSCVNLTDANLSYTNLCGTIGNNKEIITIQTDYQWIISYTSTYIQIGCKRYTHSEWFSFPDETIACMHVDALAFWTKWKPILKSILNT